MNPLLIPTALLTLLLGFFAYLTLNPDKAITLMRWQEDRNNRFTRKWFGMERETRIPDEGRFKICTRLWGLLMMVALGAALTAIRQVQPQHANFQPRGGEAQRLATELLANLPAATSDWRSRLLNLPNNPRATVGRDGAEYLASFLLRHCADGRLQAAVEVTGPRGERGWAAKIWGSTKAGK